MLTAKVETVGEVAQKEAKIQTLVGEAGQDLHGGCGLTKYEIRGISNSYLHQGS